MIVYPPPMVTVPAGKAAGIYYEVRRSGLCNRILTAAHCAAFAKLAGIQATCSWAAGKPDCDASFKDVLHPIPGLTLVDEASYKVPDNYIHARSQIRGPSGFYAHTKMSRFGVSLEQFVATVRGVCRKIQPSQQVAHKLRQAETRIPIGKCIGLHVRCSDLLEKFKDHWGIKDKSEIHQKYDVKIRSFPPNVPLFLATDNQDSQRYFLRKYKGRIHVWVKDWVQRDNGHVYKNGERDSSVLDAAVDLFLLSRCAKIVAMPASSYCLTAHQLTRTPIDWAWHPPKVEKESHE